MVQGDGSKMYIQLPENVFLLEQTRQLVSILTMIRNRNASRGDFVFYANRVIRLLMDAGVESLPTKQLTIETPVGREYTGLQFQGTICGVSIMRAGESMEHAFRDICRDARIGKILIQRNENDASVHFYYSKLPSDIASRYILLFDPMLATGNSICRAIKELQNHKVKLERIIFLNVIACPEGIKKVMDEYPTIKLITAAIDEGLDKNNFIIPGLGDFGDRYFGT